MKTLATAVFSAALVGIVANAVLFQKGRHPAPLFDPLQGAASDPPAKPARTAADAGPIGAVAHPGETPPSADPVADALSGTATANPAPPRRNPAVPGHAAKPGTGDAIGQLLRGAPGEGGKTGSAPTIEAKANPAVLRAQRQLQKLGYAVKPDGQMDGGTRQAIKRFAHDHHVKADAALTPALRREIADASAAPKAGAPAPPKAR